MPILSDQQQRLQQRMLKIPVYRPRSTSSKGTASKFKASKIDSCLITLLDTERHSNSYKLPFTTPQIPYKYHERTDLLPELELPDG